MTAWLTLAALLHVSLPGQAVAAVSWFSKARGVESRSEKVSAMLENVSDQTIFDLAISLYNDPSGDDDPDNDTGSEQQTAYERIIRFWADGVCEESNGAHKLGRVRIFKNGSFPAADVIWNQREHPRATPSGFGTGSGQLIFGDVFPDGAGTGNDFNMLADPEAAGYTLAHEWGHYTYGIYDEYRGQDAGIGRPIYWPRSSDNPAVPSIMNSQWNAVSSRGGDLDWLNHSTSNNYQADTGQGRAYGASGWDVLVRSSNDDPRNGARKNLPVRRQYTALSGVAPTAADNWVRVELPGSQASCRSELEILWMEEEDLEIQLVIDRSGSMSGDPIDNAKQAAQTLVDVVPEGRTALGVVAFSDSVQQTVPITAIPVPGAATKTDIKNEIDAISATGFTALFDAADIALSNLEAYRTTNQTNANRVVFLLSDGEDNSSSTTAANVTADYLAADVPLITFGYGSAAPQGVLRQLADGTGGLFFASPTTLAQIQNAFLAAISSVSSTVTVGSFQVQAQAGTGAVDSFAVDSTLESLSILVSYDGSLNDLTFSVQSPQGVVPGVAFSCQVAAGANSCVAQVDAATLATGGAGTWTLSATNSSGASIPVTGSILATPAAGRTYEILAASASGSTVSYPEPIVITASVSQGVFITEVNVSATVTRPDGSSQVFSLSDDGQGADGLAGDGVYSLLLGYEDDGTYTVDIRADNAAGTGVFAREGFAASANIHGEEPPALPVQPVTESFERLARVQVTVEGVEASGGDDHPDAPPGTPLPTDNSDVPGRIDIAGDADYFALQGITPGQPLAVRVTDTALGMVPELTLFRPDGTVLRSGNAGSASSRTGYIFFVLSPGDVPASGTLSARVRHTSGTASGGTYRISAGPALASDQAGGTGACSAGSEVLCLESSRFSVQVEWEDFQGNRGSGRATSLGDSSGYFWYFGPDNIEIALNLTDGRTTNGHFWVSYAALSNVMYTIRITDTTTGNTATYVNPSHQFASVRDLQAFPATTAAGPSHRLHSYQPGDEPRRGRWVAAGRGKEGTCTASAQNACLNGGRFEVKVTWTDDQGSRHTANASSLTGDTGAFRFADPNGLDLLVKVLDGRGFNGRYWVFFGALSDAEYQIEVTDTQTGQKRSYLNPRGELASVGDTRGFPGN